MNITITEFGKRDAESFARLNYEWMNEYSLMDDRNEEILTNPQNSVIESGGYIYLAKKGSEVIGTVALVKIDESHFKLMKMTVAKAYRGKGIGILLLNAAISHAEEFKAKKLTLESSTKLKAAIGLYTKLGFLKVKKNTINHCDIEMELTF